MDLSIDVCVCLDDVCVCLDVKPTERLCQYLADPCLYLHANDKMLQVLSC